MKGMSIEYIKEMCKAGQEGCCAFLVAGSEGFECAKGTGLQQLIDLRLAEGTMNATGDNCNGRNALDEEKVA